MKRRSHSSSSGGPSNIPTARNRQHKQQQEEAQLRISQIRNTSRNPSSPAPSSTTKTVSRSTTPNRTVSDNNNLPGLASSSTKKPMQPSAAVTTTNRPVTPKEQTPLSTLTKKLSSAMTLLSPASSLAQPPRRSSTPSTNVTDQQRSVQRDNNRSLGSSPRSTSSAKKTKTVYTPPDYGIASLSKNSPGPSRSVSREPVRSATPKRNNSTTTPVNKLPTPLVDNNVESTNTVSMKMNTMGNDTQKMNKRTSSTPKTVVPVVTETNKSMGNSLTNIMELLFSPSKSKPAQPLTIPANSYAIRSSWNTTRRAPPINPQEFTSASYPTVPNTGKGAYVNLSDENNGAVKRNRAGSQSTILGSVSSASTIDGSSSTTVAGNRPILGPRAKIMPGKTVSRMQLIKGRLSRVSFLGISFALAFLSWGQFLERITGKSFICYPANSIIEPICLSSSLCLATNEYQNYTLADKSTVRISECAYFECIPSTVHPNYRTIGIRVPSTENTVILSTTNIPEEVSKGMVTSTQDLVTTDGSSNPNTSNHESDSSSTINSSSLCSLQIQSSWYELFSYRVLILPAEAIRFVISMIMPSFALRSGGLIETGYVVGMIVAIAME